MLLSAFESSRNERTPCECCGSLKFTPVHLRENNTLVVHCDECHLEFVNPLPTVESMQKNYQKEMTGGETESGLIRVTFLKDKHASSLSRNFTTPG